MSQQILTTLDFNASGKIINLPDGVANQDAATVAQLNAAIEGLSWKDNVLVASPGANINLASPGATIDGVTMTTANPRFLAKDQTVATENGIYIWNGSAIPATRAVDANAPKELSQAVVTVESGTSANASFRQTAVDPIIGTTAILWTPFGTIASAATTGTAGVAALATQAEVDAGSVTNKIVTPQTLTNWAGRVRKFAQSIGDGSATAYVVTHSLNTRDITAQVYRTSGNFDLVVVDVNALTVNTVQIVFNVAPTTNAFRVVVTA